MKIDQLYNLPLSPVVAYIVGMTLPLYKEKKIGETQYIIGAVNHNYNPRDVQLKTPNESLIYISEAEIGQHFTDINNFIRTENIEIKLLANRNSYGSISSKNGFSILIETGGKSSDECKNILRSLLDSISESSDEIKSSFIKGCFDGRCSIDWDRKRAGNKQMVVRYISVDVDRDHILQEKIYNIAKSIEISINLNQRKQDHKKNDQIRIKPEAFYAFSKKCGFFSSFRQRQILTIVQNAD